MSKDYNSVLDTAARIESSKKDYDYECSLNQWEIMFNALKELADFDSNKIAINALNAVDKEWDKLYSKESND